MTKKRAGFVPSRAQIGWASLGLALLGWVGLLLFTYVSPPAPSALPIFVAILVCAVAASVAPVFLWVHARLDKSGRRPLRPPLRQALGVGVWVGLCAWLQWMRILSWVTALLLLVVLALVEWFFFSRRSVT